METDDSKILLQNLRKKNDNLRCKITKDEKSLSSYKKREIFVKLLIIIIAYIFIFLH